MRSSGMFKTVDQLRRTAEREYGLSFEEALEMAYENATEQFECLRKENAGLRKRLDAIAVVLEAVDGRAIAADGPVTSTRNEITDAEYRKIYKFAKGATR